MFFVHSMLGKFEKETNSGHFGFVVEETRARISQCYRDVTDFEKLLFKMVFVYTKTQSRARSSNSSVLRSVSISS